MQAIVIYESMFGNTRQIAEAIAEGLSDADGLADFDILLSDVDHLSSADVGAADLMIVGGPTHVHGMSREGTRAEAGKWAFDLSRGLTLEPGAPGRGIRDWAGDPATVVAPLFAAFSTRSDIPIVLSGNAAARLDHVVRRLGSHRVMHPETFLVTKDNRLRDGEITRARIWGRRLGREASALITPTPTARS